MKIIRPSRIMLKMVFFGLVLIATTITIMSFALLNYESSKASEDLLQRSLIFAQFASKQIYTDYVNQYTHIHSQASFDRFRTSIEEKLRSNPDVVKMSLIGTNGKVLFDSDEIVENEKYDGPGRYVTDEEALQMIKREYMSYREAILGGERTVEIFQPIEEDSGGHFTTMNYVVSFASISERIAEINMQILMTLLPIIAISLLFVIPFSLTLTRPIVKLRAVAEKVSKGNLSVRANIRTRDEVGELARTFDEMTSALKESRKALEKYSRELEKKVKERTVELEESKRNLEERNSELERFNKLAVGRELRMVELKRQIKELESRLKR